MAGHKERERVDDRMIAAARELFLRYEGRQHERIEREMRAGGWNFYRELLYSRRRAGGVEKGWPERFGWRRQAAGSAKRTRRSRHEFEDWLKAEFPVWHWRWKYQRYLYERLDRVTKGKCTRLMVFMPPRHGKSETVTVRYTAWRLLREPKLNVILASYNQRLADSFSRKIKRIVQYPSPKGTEIIAQVKAAGHNPGIGPFHSSDPEGVEQVLEYVAPLQGAAPNATEPGVTLASLTHPRLCSLSPSGTVQQGPALLNTSSEWETSGGGIVRSVGVGGGIAGFGAGLVVIDDPVRNRADAESETYREKVWEWFNDDIYTRLESDGAIVLIQTRWHEDDLAGRLLKEQEAGGEKWEVIKLPALAEGNGCPLGRRPGQALCPKRFGAAALERIRKKIGTYSFSALYQQDPVPAAGGRFKREWFRNIVDAAPDGLRWKRGYDLAISTRTSADYTASFRCAFDRQGNLYIAEGFRKRIEYPEQRRYIIERMRTEPNTEHGIEAAMHGKAVVQELRREPTLRRFAFREVAIEADKLTRALWWLNLAEAGKVFLVRGPWMDEFVDEVCRFPSGRYDDQVDAVSIAVSMLSKTGFKAMGF